jgi:hypothetical protein
MNKQVLAISISVMASIPFAVHAAEPATMTVDDISTCMRGNIVDRGSLRDFDIMATDREGKTNSVKVKLFWKPTRDDAEARMTLQVAEPESYAGTSYLVVSGAEEEQIYMYLPALNRVQAVTGGDMTQTLWGTDFTFADVKQVQGVLLDGDTTRDADGTVFDRPAYVLTTITTLEQSGYNRVVTYVDQESCTLMKTELFTDGATPAKVLEADISSLLEVEPYWLMLGYTMTDLNNGTHTDLKLSDVFLLERLPESLFTPEGFNVVQE